MRRLLVGMLVLASVTFAQIPNSGFENWTLNVPDSWSTTQVNVTKSTTAHSGSASVRGEVVTIGPAVLQPILQSGVTGRGFGVSVRHAGVTGWYQLNAVSGDVFVCNFNMFKGTQPIATGAQTRPAASGWTQFSVPFTYYGSGTPDTCILQFQIIGSGGGTVHAGSWFLLDDLAFTGVNAIDDKELPATFMLSQNWPNPFNPTTVVRAQWPAASDVKLVVYDLLGQEVAVLADGRYPAERHEFTFDARALPTGVYVYRLTAGSFVQARTMVLIR